VEQFDPSTGGLTGRILAIHGQIVWWIPFVVVISGAFGSNLYLLPQFRIYAAWNRLCI